MQKRSLYVDYHVGKDEESFSTELTFIPMGLWYPTGSGSGKVSREGKVGLLS